MNGAELHRSRVASVASEYPLRDLLLVCIFALYPFHAVMDLVVQANVSYADPVVGAVLVLWLVGAFGAVRIPRYSVLLALFGFVALLSLGVNALDPVPYFSLRRGLVKFVKLLGSTAWFVAVFALVRRDPSRYVATAATISIAVASAFALLALHDAMFLATDRQTGPFQNPNLFGNYLVFNACLGLYLRETWVATRWPRSSWLALGAVGVIASGVLATGSRGSLLAAGLAGGTIFVGSAQFSRRDGLVAVAVGALTVAVGTILVWLTAPALVGRFLSTENLEGRFHLWETALEAFASSPLFGIGYGQYQEYLVAEGGREIGSHNTYLLVASELGVVGVVPLLALLGSVFRDGLRALAREPKALFLLAFVVGTAGQALVTDVDNFRSLWIALGAIAAYHAFLDDQHDGLREPLTAEYWIEE